MCACVCVCMSATAAVDTNRVRWQSLAKISQYTRANTRASQSIVAILSRLTKNYGTMCDLVCAPDILRVFTFTHTHTYGCEDRADRLFDSNSRSAAAGRSDRSVFILHKRDSPLLRCSHIDVGTIRAMGDAARPEALVRDKRDYCMFFVWFVWFENVQHVLHLLHYRNSYYCVPLTQMGLISTVMITRITSTMYLRAS